MRKLIGFVNHSLKDFFISNLEDPSYSSNLSKNCTPYSFTDSNFKAVLVGQPEKFSDFLINLKAFDDLGDIVPQSNQGSDFNLGSKIVRLAFVSYFRF